MMEVTIFVEGGGQSKDLRKKCRAGFSKFIEKAGMKGKMPSIVPCGSRNNALDIYRDAVSKGEEAILLVDSERPVDDACQFVPHRDWSPWTHLKYGTGDGWDKPGSVSETDCHLMVECMEYWFFADRKTLEKFFGKKFMKGALPSDKKPPESVGKDEALEGLAKAPRRCGQKGSYRKGKHSFELLSEIYSAMVLAACPWAARFVDLLREKMEA